MARCSRCGRRFPTLDDERDMHPCPSCGFAPWDPIDEWDDEDEDEDEEDGE